MRTYNFVRKNFKLSILLIIILVTTPAILYGQNYKFRKYGVQEGICHPFVYTINQDKNGYIWIGTGEGLCNFDGFNFAALSTSDSVAGDVVQVSFKDSLGNLWFGHNNGSISLYDGISFKTVSVKEKVNSTITSIIQVGDGLILAASQNDGVLLLENAKEIARYKEPFANKFITSVLTVNSDLLVGFQEGLYIYSVPTKKEQPKLISEVKELEYVKIQDIEKSSHKNSFWVATEDEGLFYITLNNGSYTLKKVGEKFNLSNENIQNILEDRESNLWLSTLRSGVFKLSGQKEEGGEFTGIINYNKNNGLGINFVKQVYEDREGNIWVATYGNGLAFMIDEAFTFYTFSQTPFGNNILSVTGNDSTIWVGNENGLLRLSTKSDKKKFFGTSSGLPDDNISTLFLDNNNTLWIGTGNHGLMTLNTRTDNISKLNYASNSLGNSVNSITGDGENIYIATKDGIYVYNTKTHSKLHYSTINRLPHNDIDALYIDSDNRILIATQANGIYQLDEKGEINEYLSTGNIELEINSLTRDNKGSVWATTYGNGVFIFKKDTIINLTAKLGLKSNYCYSIMAVDSNYVWVGHRLGISRVNINDFSVKVYDTEYGITGDCNLNATFKDSKGIVYFGTTDGLIRYNYVKDQPNKIPPKTNIKKVIISDKAYGFRKKIELPYSAYKLRIEFIGLDYKNPAAVKYQYKLEGYDLDWSEITSLNYAIYPRVEDGHYTFKVRSFNEAGKYEESPAEFQLDVKLPVWKTWWFITLVFIFVVLSVFIIIKIRERKQKQLQEYLERKLDERTREVVEQKEEIEIKNKDITDSINYAQRIQASILPPIKKLQQNFSGSFVYYQPRDIVSGDFYWFDKISEYKFVIVCADSTGHGVPGAFMSMIGTTLIKDICMRDEAKTPSEILKRLDSELRNTLNQNLEAEKSNDGMDIIVCEIDTRTNYLRYASAMRPMIIYCNGEQIYVKGSRSSVGGHYDKEDKEFLDEGMQLSKGDIIYMFSDGYPDQFGGPMGKKFKMVRLKNLLKDIYQKPMEEQFNYVKSTFNLWKEDLEQVDDVLFMGIKL
jgi:ligand-binding sensor domain-containing protein/serine phosphatase RsbU (regulator of sigma subunit)